MERHAPTTSFQLSDNEFRKIRSLVFQATGISLSNSKTELVKRRFSPRIKALGLNGFDDYIRHVRNNGASELEHFCDAITTNLTSFFRENHHFEFLKASGIDEICRRQESSKRIRIWSAGCSTGQEAYCLAITFLSTLKYPKQWDLKILGTDLDNKCLAKCRAGLYREKEFNNVPDAILNEYFSRREISVGANREQGYMANQALKDLITFNKLNLMQQWPMKGKFQAIFCRNVFIYFDKDTQKNLIDRFATHQEPGDFLFLGHSESIANPKAAGYRLLGKTLYVRE